MASIDIVVPCFNYGRFLEACVSSILGQSISNLRVLIIDDGSSDDTFSIATKLTKSDARVCLTSHTRNIGHINTYNEGIAWASADYFLLLSADDLLAAGALQRATEIMDANPDIVLTYGECISWFDHLPLPAITSTENYTWTRHDLINEMCRTATNFVATPTAIARTIVQKSIGGYRASLPHTGDMEMWLRFAANGSVARIGAVQGIYRKHSTAMSNAYFADILPDYRQRLQAFDSFFDENEDHFSDSRNLRMVARRALANLVFIDGIKRFRRARIGDGIRLVREAINMDRRLSYAPPLWHLFKIPGPAGRRWAKDVATGAIAGKLTGRTLKPDR